MLNPTELLKNISAVVAVEVNKGFRIEAELLQGGRIVLKKLSTRKPSAIQLYSCRGNGNASNDSEGKFFGFAKKIDSNLKSAHLKTYLVK